MYKKIILFSLIVGMFTHCMNAQNRKLYGSDVEIFKDTDVYKVAKYIEKGNTTPASQDFKFSYKALAPLLAAASRGRWLAFLGFTGRQQKPRKNSRKEADRLANYSGKRELLLKYAKGLDYAKTCKPQVHAVLLGYNKSRFELSKGVSYFCL